MYVEKDDLAIKLPPGDRASVKSKVEAALAYLAATNNQVKRHPDTRSGMEICKVCEHPVMHASGLMSKMTIIANVARISTGAGYSVWCQSGVCEPCMEDIQQPTL
jgi:hypothetical protein